MMADAGMVKIHAHTIRVATVHLTDPKPRVTPTPTIPPVIVCVVDTGTPRAVAPKRVAAAAASAQKPPAGLSSVIFIPIVLMIRQPPAMVPRAMARWQIKATHRGT